MKTCPSTVKTGTCVAAPVSSTMSCRASGDLSMSTSSKGI
jgi:hypothetical protein